MTYDRVKQRTRTVTKKITDRWECRFCSGENNLPTLIRKSCISKVQKSQLSTNEYREPNCGISRRDFVLFVSRVVFAAYATGGYGETVIDRRAAPAGSSGLETAACADDRAVCRFPAGSLTRTNVLLVPRRAVPRVI